MGSSARRRESGQVRRFGERVPRAAEWAVRCREWHSQIFPSDPLHLVRRRTKKWVPTIGTGNIALGWLPFALAPRIEMNMFPDFEHLVFV
jgi:hypothetical protein